MNGVLGEGDSHLVFLLFAIVKELVVGCIYRRRIEGVEI